MPTKPPGLVCYPKMIYAKNPHPHLNGSKPPGLTACIISISWEEGVDEVVLITSEVSPVERIQETPLAITFGLSEIRFITRTGSEKRRAICSGAEPSSTNIKLAGRRGMCIAH